MTQDHKGGCHCGSVKFSITEKPELTFFCHCNDCQRRTGSPFSVELMIADTGFEVSGELSDYVVTGDSGKDVHRLLREMRLRSRLCLRQSRRAG